MADLTTLANVKQDLTITETANDAQLSRLITEISEFFINQVNRGALLEAGYSEKRNGNCGDSIVPRYYPLLAVASVTVNGISIPASPDGIQRGFVFDDWTIFLVCDRFRKGRGNVQLNYTAGYAVTPPDIERAVIDQTIFTFRRLPKLGTITQQMSGVTTATFSQKDLAPGVQGVINAYRDRSLVGL